MSSPALDLTPADPLSPLQRAAVVAIMNVLPEVSGPDDEPQGLVRDLIAKSAPAVDLSGSIEETLERFMLGNTAYQCAHLMTNLFKYAPTRVELCDLAHRVAGHYPGDPSSTIIDPASLHASDRAVPEGNLYRRVFREIAGRYLDVDIYILQMDLESAGIDVLRFAQAEVPASVTVMTVLRLGTKVQIAEALKVLGEHFPGAADNLSELASSVLTDWPVAESPGMPTPGRYLREREVTRRAWDELVGNDLIVLNTQRPGTLQQCLAETAPQLKIAPNQYEYRLLDIAFSKLYEEGSTGLAALHRMTTWNPPFIGIYALAAAVNSTGTSTRFHQRQIETLRRDEQPALILATNLARLILEPWDQVTTAEVGRILTLVHDRPQLFQADIPALQRHVSNGGSSWHIAAAVLHCLGEFRPFCEQTVFPQQPYTRLRSDFRLNLVRFLFELESHPHASRPLVSQTCETLLALNSLYPTRRISLF